MMKTKNNKKIKTLDIVLIIDFSFLAVFTIVMIVIFCIYGAIPDTLCTCVYSTGGGEFGVAGTIKVFKEIGIRRQHELEDRDYEERKDKHE